MALLLVAIMHIYQPNQMNVSEEIRVQGEVLRDLSRGNASVLLELINRIAGEMRDILMGFEAQHKRVPTAAEIVWILGEHHCFDPRLNPFY
jgi:hypothetical protein